MLCLFMVERESIRTLLLVRVLYKFDICSFKLFISSLVTGTGDSFSFLLSEGWVGGVLRVQEMSAYALLSRMFYTVFVRIQELW